MINCYYNISFASWGPWHRSYDINSNLIKWFWVFLDRFQWGFSSSSLSSLADLAGSNILNDILFHSRPVIILRGFLIGVILTKVASKGCIMELFEGFNQAGARDNLTISLLSSSRFF